jgi:hypothetical protein
MRNSADAGLISATDRERWDGAIRLRNTLVHNNGIAEETAVYSYPDVTLQLADGQMAQGDLRLFPYMAIWVTEAFASWSDSLLQ